MSLGPGLGLVMDMSPIQRGLGPGGPYIVRSNALWIMVKWDSHVDRMTDRHDWKHYIPELLWRGGNYCCYRDNGDFTQWNRPSLKRPAVNSWCSLVQPFGLLSFGVSSLPFAIRSTYSLRIFYEKNNWNIWTIPTMGIVTPIWVFPNCFHWIQRIQWQKYLSLQ